MKYAFEWNGNTLLVANMFDADGVEVHDPNDAEILIAELPDGEWLTCRCVLGNIKALKLQ